MRRQVSVFRLLLPLAALGLGGCAELQGLFGKGSAFGGRQAITFRIADRLNDDYPVAVELIVLYDEDLDGELSALTARQWFDKRRQYLRDFSRQQLVTFRWEWTPGQTAPPQRFRYRPGALALLLFASYSSPGEHRIRLTVPEGPLRVQLEEREFHVETERPWPI